MNDFMYENMTRVYFGSEAIQHLKTEFSSIGKRFMFLLIPMEEVASPIRFQQIWNRRLLLYPMD